MKVLLFTLLAVLLLSGCGGAPEPEATSVPTPKPTDTLESPEPEATSSGDEAQVKVPTPKPTDTLEPPEPSPGPQKSSDLLITEEEANAVYVGTWKFSADAEYGEPDPAACRDFVDDSAQNLWYVSFYNCVFDPDPNRTIEGAKERYPTATLLDSTHRNEN